MSAAMAEWILLAVVGLPSVVGAGLILAAASSRRGAARRVAPVLSLLVAALVVGGVVAIAVGGGRPSVSVPFLAGAAFGLAVDGLSAVVLVTVGVVAALVLAFAVGHVHDDPARFHGLMLAFVAAVLVTASATTLPALIVGWELMGAASYALIGFPWRQSHALDAGRTALLATRTADLGLYVAAAAALAGAGADGGSATLRVAGLAQLSPGWRSVAAAGLLVAAAGKAAQLPFSFWLSGAMAGPSPVSALLHSAAMVAMGGYLLLRVAPLLAATGWAADAAAWLGALSALALGVVALAQHDLKQLLAASTVAQLGYVLLAAGVGAVGAGAAHLAAHAATKSLLFLAAGVWLVRRGATSLTAMTGVARDDRVVGVSFTVGALALAGIPPLSLWATKDAILAAAQAQSTLLYGVGLAGAALSAAYAAKALAVVWGPGPPATAASPGQVSGGAPVSAGQPAPLVVLAVGAGLAGLLALPPVGGWLARLVASGPAAPMPSRPAGTPMLGELDSAQATLSGLLALGVAGLVGWTVRRGWSWSWPAARNWLGLPTVVQSLVARPTTWAAGRLAQVDTHVVDAAVEGAGRGTLAVARAAARVDTGGVDGAVQALARMVRTAGLAARRPQTGLLHQYYAQALALLTGLVVVLLMK